jgi:hypothetical protein
MVELVIINYKLLNFQKITEDIFSFHLQVQLIDDSWFFII